MIWATRFHTHRTAYHEGNLENTRMDCRTRSDLMVRPLAHLDIDHTRSGEPIMTTLTLVDPQPMESFPLTGTVYVAMKDGVVGYSEGEVDIVKAELSRRYDLLPIYTAWSLNAEPLSNESNKEE